jgi:hypothetical protein
MRVQHAKATAMDGGRENKRTQGPNHKRKDLVRRITIGGRIFL